MAIKRKPRRVKAYRPRRKKAYKTKVGAVWIKGRYRRKGTYKTRKKSPSKRKGLIKYRRK